MLLLRWLNSGPFDLLAPQRLVSALKWCALPWTNIKLQLEGQEGLWLLLRWKCVDD
jgi:hypothetical protein